MTDMTDTRKNTLMILFAGYLSAMEGIKTSSIWPEVKEVLDYVGPGEAAANPN